MPLIRLQRHPQIVAVVEEKINTSDNMYEFLEKIQNNFNFIIDSITWRNTPQGHYFWEEIPKGFIRMSQKTTSDDLKRISIKSRPKINKNILRKSFDLSYDNFEEAVASI